MDAKGFEVGETVWVHLAGRRTQGRIVSITGKLVYVRRIDSNFTWPYYVDELSKRAPLEELAESAE